MRTVKHPERGERLEKFLNELNIKNIQLAQRLGLGTPAFISQLLNKKASVTLEMANRISEVYPRLNVNWLLHGKGPMLNDENYDVVEVAEPESSYGGDPFEALRKIIETQARQIQDHEERIRALEEGKE